MDAKELDTLCLRTAAAHAEAIAMREEFKGCESQVMRDAIDAICRSALATHEDAQRLRDELKKPR